jgi:hypothetical protein
MLIPNEQLTLDHLPDPLDRNAVFAFAMSFDGYEHFGSFEAASQNARTHSRATLTDIRNELFMHARGSRHRGDDRFLEQYRDMFPRFRELLAAQSGPDSSVEADAAKPRASR